MGGLLSLLLLLMMTTGAQAQERLSIHLSDASISQLAQEVQRQVDYTFVYAEAMVKDVRVNIDIKDAELTEVLSVALKDTGLSFRITNRHIVIGRARPNNDAPKPEGQTRTISGYIKDADSRETLIGATIFCLNTSQAVSSNEYGFFSITLPQGDIALLSSYIGYETQSVALADGDNVALNIFMHSDNRIEEVLVRADRPETGSASTRTGAESVPVSYINQLPCLLSEPDVMRALHSLPGVQKGISGTSGIFVRGGGQEQNLFLLDGVSLYNVDHIFGFMSAFMPDAVKNVDFYKSAFPARYGGRLSSVVDVRTKDGDMQSYHGAFSIGLLSSHASLEGPIKTNRTSFCISARRSYIDGLYALMRKIGDKSNSKGLRPSFYDINAKLNHIVSDSDRLFFSFYLGRDAYRYNLKEHTDRGMLDESGEVDKTCYSNTKTILKSRWGNILGSVRWNHIYSPRLFSNTTIAYNKFSFNIKHIDLDEAWEHGALTLYDRYENRFKSGISDVSLMHDLDFHPAPSHHVRMGAQYVIHRFLPEVRRGASTTKVNGDVPTTENRYDVDGTKSIANDMSLYAEDDMSISDNFQMIIGLRANLFAVEGKAYPVVEPRWSACFKPNASWRIKTSYAMMHQYVHLLSSMPISLPTDLWVPVSKSIKPMTSNQVSAGIYTDIVPTVNISVEAYYKWLDNVLDFKDGANFTGNTSVGWQRLVESGQGRSKGIELSVKRSEGRLTGQLSYSLSKTEHKYGDAINAGRWFPFRFDRRHVLNVVTQWRVNERVDFGAQWNFSSGICITVPDKMVRIELPAPNFYYSKDINEMDYVVCSARNNYRVEPTHSLDVNVNFHKKLKHVSRTLSISVMNVYARRNADVVYAELQNRIARENGTLRPSNGEILDTDLPTREVVIAKNTVIPILPSISYRISF